MAEQLLETARHSLITKSPAHTDSLVTGYAPLLLQRRGDPSNGEASHSACCRPGRAGATREDGRRSNDEASHSVCCRPGRAGSTREDVVLEARAVISLSWNAGELVKCTMTPSSRNVEELLAGGQDTYIHELYEHFAQFNLYQFLFTLSLSLFGRK